MAVIYWRLLYTVPTLLLHPPTVCGWPSRGRGRARTHGTPSTWTTTTEIYWNKYANNGQRINKATRANDDVTCIKLVLKFYVLFLRGDVNNMYVEWNIIIIIICHQFIMLRRRERRRVNSTLYPARDWTRWINTAMITFILKQCVGGGASQWTLTALAQVS